jgi:hypothetical protein
MTQIGAGYLDRNLPMNYRNLHAADNWRPPISTGG